MLKYMSRNVRKLKSAWMFRPARVYVGHIKKLCILGCPKCACWSEPSLGAHVRRYGFWYYCLIVFWVTASQVHSQAEAMKPGLQHKFCTLTLFSPKIWFVPMTSNAPWHSISYWTTCPLSKDSDQPAQMRKLWSPGFNKHLTIRPYFHQDVVRMTSNGPGHSISYKTTCPLNNDSDQPARRRSRWSEALLCTD